MFRIRLSESAMPTGSKDPDVLLAWLLDSMGLVRRKSEGMSIDDEQGALHRLMRETLLSAVSYTHLTLPTIYSV